MSTTRALSALLLLAFAGRAAAQDAKPAEPPPPPLTGSLGAGLAITGGNSDTKTYNLALALVYDPKLRNVVKLDGVYIRGEADGVDTVDKTSLSIRDEYKLSGRAYAFGLVGYLRDRFKGVVYLVSPLVGAGWKVVAEKELELAFDAGVGGFFEKLSGRVHSSSGAFSAGQHFTWALSPTAKLVQNATGLWKLRDTGDALYHLDVGLALAVTKRVEVKLSFVDDYKTRPPSPEVKKNDTALLATVLLKI